LAIDSGFEADSRRAIAISYVISVASALLDALIFLQFRVSSEWVGYLILVAFFGAFALDWIAAWNGIYEKFSLPFLTVLAGLNGIVIFVLALATGTASDDAAYTMIGVIFLMGLLEGLEHVYIQARIVVRVFRGLRTSGDLLLGSVAATVDSEVLDTLGVDSFESRLQRELEDAAEDRVPLSFKPKAETDLGFNIQRVGPVRILFRIENGFLEALCVPTDGAVARFDNAEDDVRSVRFIAHQILHFGTPSPAQLETIRSHVREVYAKYAAATFDVRGVRKSIVGTWRIRRDAILVAILAVVVVGAGALAIFNAPAVISFLSEPQVNIAAATIFYIGGTIALVAAFLRWVSKRLGRKSGK